MKKAKTLSLSLLFFTLTSISQPGSLNTSFGSSGFVVINFGDLEDYGYAMAIQADGSRFLYDPAKQNIDQNRLLFSKAT